MLSRSSNNGICCSIGHPSRDPGFIEDIFETLRTSTDLEVRENAISTVTKLIKNESVEILDPRFNHFLSQAVLEEKDEQVREKLETLLKRSENRSTRYTDSNETDPEDKTDDDDVYGAIRLPYLKNLTLKKLLPLGAMVLAFAIYLGFRPKTPEDIEKASGQVNTAETDKISNPPDISEKDKYITVSKDEKSPFHYPDRTIPIRVTILNPMIKPDLIMLDDGKPQKKIGINDYMIKPHPYAGLIVRTRTEILKRTFLNKKLKQKIKAIVYEAEEITRLSRNHFETRIATIRKSQNIKNLHFYKYLEPGEIAYATYTHRGVIKEYKAHSRGNHLWHPESYLGFVYPRTRVKINKTWNSPLEKKSELLQYRMTDLMPFQGTSALRVELESSPTYMTQVNEDPSRKVPAHLSGYYYLNVKTGKIIHFTLLKKYSYTLSKPEGKFEIRLTYRTETY